jgi:hypothetical protein
MAELTGHCNRFSSARNEKLTFAVEKKVTFSSLHLFISEGDFQQVTYFMDK